MVAARARVQRPTAGCGPALRIPAATPNDGAGSDRREDVMGIGWQILWVVCGVATVASATLAARATWARYLGRAATGVLFLLGGALVHIVNLATGVDYAGFADPAHFGWVTHAWRAAAARGAAGRAVRP
jgi:hypothetical protein